MRFVARGLFGLVILAMTLGILVVAGRMVFDTVEARNAQADRPRVARERVFAVEVQTITPGSHAPVIRTFGEVVSGRTLELRAAAGGEVVQLASNFREGATVQSGDLLFQTDPAAAETRLLLAEAELEEARSDLADAQSDFSLAEADVAAAQKQADLRNAALRRQESLKERGVGTDTALESAQLAAASAEQSVVSKRMAQSSAQSRITRAENAVARKVISYDEAVRVFEDSSVYAEFDGVLTNVTGVLGGLVSPNERLGELIDPGALEVSFRISTAEYAQLAAHDGGLGAAEVQVHMLGQEAPLPTRIARVGASVGEGQTGRALFAELGAEAARNLRPGDFLTVEVFEPPLQGVAVIPARAATAAGEVLVMAADSRLEEIRVPILRSQGDTLVVEAAAIAGRDLVLARAPQLGAGVKVEPRTPGGPAITAPTQVRVSQRLRDEIRAVVEGNAMIPKPVKDRLLGALEQDVFEKDRIDQMLGRMGIEPQDGDITPLEGGATAPTTEPAPEKVIVSQRLRDEIRTIVSGNAQMPAAIRDRILTALDSEEMEQAQIERLVDRMGIAVEDGDIRPLEPAARVAAAQPDAAPATQGETIAIADEKRAQLIAFVEGNSFIPDDRKAQMLEALAQPQVPRALVDRISARMGG